MPKLSQETLANRNQCPHCSDTFRGRAALSGHIQFKHPPAAGGKEANFKEFMEQKGLLEIFAPACNFDKKETSRIVELRRQWELIKLLLVDANFSVNKADLKTYMIASIAQMKANQRLLDEIGHEMIEPIIKMIENQTKAIQKLSG